MGIVWPSKCIQLLVYWLHYVAHIYSNNCPPNLNRLAATCCRFSNSGKGTSETGAGKHRKSESTIHSSLPNHRCCCICLSLNKYISNNNWCEKGGRKERWVERGRYDTRVSAGRVERWKKGKEGRMERESAKVVAVSTEIPVLPYQMSKNVVAPWTWDSCSHRVVTSTSKCQNLP